MDTLTVDLGASPVCCRTTATTSAPLPMGCPAYQRHSQRAGDDNGLDLAALVSALALLCQAACWRSVVLSSVMMSWAGVGRAKW